MARKGIGFFDSRGHYFKAPAEATISDLSAVLGRIGEGDNSMAEGIANMLLERREDIERIFAEHEQMMAEHAKSEQLAVEEGENVTPLPLKDKGKKKS